MGADPVDQLEVHEVTVQLAGEVGVAAFDQYKAKLDTFIKAASAIQDASHGNRKLKVRVVREAVRSAGP